MNAISQTTKDEDGVQEAIRYFDRYVRHNTEQGQDRYTATRNAANSTWRLYAHQFSSSDSDALCNELDESVREAASGLTETDIRTKLSACRSERLRATVHEIIDQLKRDRTLQSEVRGILAPIG